MKLQLSVAIVFLVSVALFASVNVAQAQWPAITNGYAVTTNWHGSDIPFGQSVVVTAGTTDSQVKRVEFVWHYPNGSVAFDENVTVSGPLVTPAHPPDVPEELVDWANQHDGSDPIYPKITYWYAQSTYMPNVLGDWGVQALFRDSGNIRKGQGNQIIKIRATSFNAVPEMQFGTIAILVSMFGALGVFALKKKRTTGLHLKP